MALRGLFIGDDEECFRRAAALSLEVNVELLDEPLEKVVVFLDPGEYKSTWLGNKSIYRTRMALADGGELVVLAPGGRAVRRGPGDRRLIRKYGYAGTSEILDLMADDDDADLAAQDLQACARRPTSSTARPRAGSRSPTARAA